jgi:drug/metabolite transporter (DMT)-like permease
LLLFVTGQAVLAWAETRIPSGVASLLIATEPLFVVLLAWRVGAAAGSAPAAPSPVTLAGIGTGFVGVGALVLPGTGSDHLDPLAAAAVVLAALSWSVGIFRAGSRAGLGAAQTAGMQLLSAGAMLVALSLAVGEFGRLPATGPSLRSLVALSYLVIFGSIIGFGAYVWLLGRVSAQHVATHAYVNPLVAVALGASLNREPLTPELFVAGLLIVGSVAMLLRGRSADGERSAHARLHAVSRRDGRWARWRPDQGRST